MFKYLIEKYLVKVFCEEIKNCFTGYDTKRVYKIYKNGEHYKIEFESTTHKYQGKTVIHRVLKIYPRNILFLRQENITTFARYIDGIDEDCLIY